MLLMFKQLHKARMKEESFLVYSNESAAVGNGYKCSNRKSSLPKTVTHLLNTPFKEIFISDSPCFSPSHVGVI